MSSRDRRYRNRHDETAQRKLRAAAEAEVARLTLELSFASDRLHIALARADEAEAAASALRFARHDLRIGLDAAQIEIACLLDTERHLKETLADVIRERDRYREQALDYDRVRDERDKLRQRIDAKAKAAREAPKNRAALVFRAPKVVH